MIRERVFKELRATRTAPKGPVRPFSWLVRPPLWTTARVLVCLEGKEPPGFQGFS
jgi:hypothetical protein